MAMICTSSGNSKTRQALQGMRTNVFLELDLALAAVKKPNPVGGERPCRAISKTAYDIVTDVPALRHAPSTLLLGRAVGMWGPELGRWCVGPHCGTKSLLVSATQASWFMAARCRRHAVAQAEITVSKPDDATGVPVWLKEGQ